MKITPIHREHFEQWRQLRQLLFTDLDPEFHEAEVEWLYDNEKTGCFLVHSEAGETIGFLELSLRDFVDGCLEGPVGYIEGIYVMAGFRSQGIGRALIRFAEDWCRKKGCEQMATDAEIDNLAAQQFYLENGFQERWKTVGFTKSLVDKPISKGSANRHPA